MVHNITFEQIWPYSFKVVQLLTHDDGQRRTNNYSNRSPKDSADLEKKIYF